MRATERLVTNPIRMGFVTRDFPVLKAQRGENRCIHRYRQQTEYNIARCCNRDESRLA